MKKSYTIPRDQLDGVAAFLRVAERRSFRAAAEDLGVSPSAISQTIKALEARVGVPLLSRTTRSVGLTEAGERFFQQARPAFDGLNGAFEAARSFGERPAGLLRLNVPRSVVRFVIEPVLAGFCRAYPAVQVEVIGEDQFVDLVETGFDAGIRLGESLAADVVAVRLTPPFRYAVAASPDYLARHGRPQRPSDLRHHSCIRIRGTGGGLYAWWFQDGNRTVEVDVDGPVICNQLSLSQYAAVEGLGLAYLADPLIAEDVRAGRLETVLDEFAATSPGVFLYYPQRGQVLPKLRAFIDYLVDHRDQFAETLGAMTAPRPPLPAGREAV